MVRVHGRHNGSHKASHERDKVRDMDATQARFYGELRRGYGWTIPNALDGARLLAWADREGLDVQWSEDWDVDHTSEFPDAYDAEPTTCEYAHLTDAEGEGMGPALGCVDDADASYRREVEVDLIAEHYHATFEASNMLPLGWNVLQAAV